MLAQRYGYVLTIYLALEGLQGLFSPTAYAIFTVNTAHAWTAIAIALVGFFWGLRGPQVSLYLSALGIVLMLVGAMRFIPDLDNFIVHLFNVNIALAIFNLIVGAATALIGIMSWRQRMEPMD